MKAIPIKCLEACLLTLVLSACASLSRPAPAQGSAAWALGETPTFSGALVDWAKGDAIAPGEAEIFATTYQTGDPEGVAIGFGAVKADGSFTFGLQKGASYAGGGVSPDKALCSGLSLSNSSLRLVGVDIFDILSLYVDGVHARPGGGIFISSERVQLGQMKDAYTFYYASGSGKVTGSCVLEAVGTVPFDLDLRQGWNVVRRDKSGFKTAPLPKTVQWYFINTLTATP